MMRGYLEAAVMVVVLLLSGKVMTGLLQFRGLEH